MSAADQELVKRMASLAVAAPVKKTSSVRGARSNKSTARYHGRDRYSRGGKRKLRKRNLKADINAMSKKKQAAGKAAKLTIDASEVLELTDEDGQAPLADYEEVIEFAWPPCICNFPHPPVPVFDPPNDRRCNYYWQIADKFPYVTLHRALLTEIKFVEADLDCSGCIEIDELYGLLKGIFRKEITDKMVIRAFKVIDKDKSGTLDFLEVLSVMNSVIQREEVFIPDIVKNNYSKVCSIQ